MNEDEYLKYLNTVGTWRVARGGFGGQIHNVGP